LDLEINRVKGQVAILISRLEDLQKDVKLSPAEIKDMEVLEVRT
jgi:RecA-family ATPase